MFKRILAAFVAAALVVVLAVPALALGSSSNGTEPKYQTPSGYNDNDYQKMVAFLEQTDENGVKNGKKLNNSYDPSNPSTWTDIYWSNGSEKRVQNIICEEKGLYGSLDLSGFSSMSILVVGINRITEIDLTGDSGLMMVTVSDNLLHTFDCSDSPNIDYLFVLRNMIKVLDFSANPNISFDRIEAAGNGTIGYALGEDGLNAAEARADENSSFLGWYDMDGNFISNGDYYNENYSSLDFDGQHTQVVARFTGWDDPAEPTDAPVEPTDAPVEPTDAPAEPTDAPAEPTDAPVEPTDAPVEPTNDPGTPSTGAVSLAALGVITVVSGAGVVLFRKK